MPSRAGRGLAVKIDRVGLGRCWIEEAVGAFWYLSICEAGVVVRIGAGWEWERRWGRAGGVGRVWRVDMDAFVAASSPAWERLEELLRRRRRLTGVEVDELVDLYQQT